MKVYLACSMTNSHDPMLLRKVVDFLHGLGHKVLSEHVAAPDQTESTRILMRNAGLDPTRLTAMDPEQIALIIRDTDFRWVEECDAFIALFFGGSDGRGAEFEHLRLMLEMQNQFNPRGIIYSHARVNCRGILGLFDPKTCSRLIWAADRQEKRYYHRHFVDPTDHTAILHEIEQFLTNLQAKETYAKS